MDRFKLKNIVFTSTALLAFFAVLGITSLVQNKDNNTINNIQIKEKYNDDASYTSDNITFSLSSNNQLLVISGTGAVRDYSDTEARPWDKYISTVTAIEIDYRVTSIGSNAFRGFEKVRNLHVYDELNYVGEYAFANCPSLSTLSFTMSNPSEMHLSSNAFDGCKSVGDIYVPANSKDSYNQIKDSFESIKKWKVLEKASFNVNRDVTWVLSSDKKTLIIDGEGKMDDFEMSGAYATTAPWDADRQTIENIVVGNHIENIGKNAFIGTSVKSHENVILGDSIEEIKDYAFALSAKLSNIVIPKSVKVIGDNVFDLCNSLTEIYFQGTELNLIGNTFIVKNTKNSNKTFYIKPDYTDDFKRVVPSNLISEPSAWAIVETKLESPTSNIEDGTYINAIDVILSASSSSEKIYYTLDGSTPSMYSTPFNSAHPIHIDSENNQPKEVTIKAISIKDLWDDSDVVSFTYKIKNRIDKPVKGNEEIIYNGKPQELPLEENPLYKITGNLQTDAGHYVATVSLIDKENNAWSDGTEEDHEIEYEIKKATFDLSSFTFQNKEVEYNKEPQSLEIEGTLPHGLTINYVGNTQTEVGTYPVTAHFSYDKNNYEPVADLNAVFTIVKRHVEMPTADPALFYYDGTEKTYYLKESEYYTIENNKATSVGTHTVIARLIDTKNTYWSDASSTAFLEFEFIINKGTYDLSNISFENDAVKYDGKEHSIQIKGTLPKGLSVSYTGSGTKVGEYDIIASFTGDYESYHEVDSMVAKLFITKVVVSKPKNDDTKYVYDGSEKTYKIEEDPYYTISSNKKTDAGAYQVDVDLVDKINTCWSDGTNEKISFLFVISQAEFDISNIVFENKTIEYDGNKHTIEIKGTLPNELRVNYIGDKDFDTIGTHPITIEFISSNPNYLTPDQKQAYLTIEKKKVNVPTIDEAKFVYNEQEQTYHVAESEFYTVSNNKKTNAGTYNVNIILIDKDKYAWATTNDSNDLSFSFVIQKAVYDMSNVRFESEAFNYDGNVHTLRIKGQLPTGVNVSYTGNGTNAGTYNIIARFSSVEIENGNYEPIQNKSATLTINKILVARPQGDPRVFTYTGQEQTYKIQANDSYIIKNNGNKKTNAGKYTIEVALNDEINYEWDNHTTENLRFTFEILKATYDISNISLTSKEFKYDGETHEIVISGTLPEGLIIEYENNSQILPGIYEVVANFIVDDNHVALNPLTATLTITSANKILESTYSSLKVEGGFITTITLNSSIIAFTKDQYATFIENGEKLLKVYSIKVTNEDGTEYVLDPNKSYVLRIKMSDDIKAVNEFIIAHIHGDDEVHYIRKGSTPSVGIYTIEDGYIVTKINKLSEFLIIQKGIVTNEGVCYFHHIQTILLIIYLTFFLIYVVLLKHTKFDILNAGSLILFALGTSVLALYTRCKVCNLLHLVSASLILVAVITHVLVGYVFVDKKKVSQETNEDVEENKEETNVNENENGEENKQDDSLDTNKEEVGDNELDVSEETKEVNETNDSNESKETNEIKESDESNNKSE